MKSLKVLLALVVMAINVNVVMAEISADTFDQIQVGSADQMLTAIKAGKSTSAKEWGETLIAAEKAEQDYPKVLEARAIAPQAGTKIAMEKAEQALYDKVGWFRWYVWGNDITIAAKRERQEWRTAKTIEAARRHEAQVYALAAKAETSRQLAKHPRWYNPFSWITTESTADAALHGVEIK